jgi:hypothetical protein
MYIDVSAAPYSANKLGTANTWTPFTNADAAGGTLYVPRGIYRIDANLTLTSDIHFEEGAVLRPNAGVTVTLNGSLDAGMFQIFDIATFAGSKGVPKKADPVVPQWWGAKGDWLNDDYPAIAAALDTVRVSAVSSTGTGATVYFPKGIYRITHPLDCTVGKYHLKGAGPQLSILRGDTGPGRAVIEFLGSAFCTVEGLQIDTTSVSGAPSGTPTATPSTVGVLLGRVTAVDTGQPNQSWFVNLRECFIEMQGNMDANGSHGTVGVYNYGCEVSNIHNVMVVADVPVVYTGGNVFALTSYHRPAGGTLPMINVGTSMTVVTATGANAYFAIGGPALYVNGAANVHVSAHLSSWGSYPAAVYVSGMLTDFEHRGTIEVFPRMLRTIAGIRGARLYGVMMNYQSGHPLIHLATDPRVPAESVPQILDSILHIIPGPDAYMGTPPLVDGSYMIDSDTSWPGMVDGSLIFLNRAKVRIANAFPESGFNGNLVLSDQNLASVSITSGNRTGNVVKAADGLEEDGPKLGLGTTAAATTPGSVVRKVEVFDRSGASLGFVPIYNTIT